MKSHTSIIMIAALLTMGVVACNNPEAGNNNSTGQTDTAGMRQVLVTDEMYTCTMHNEVMSNKPGKCPKCGMTLVKQKMTDAQMKMMEKGTYVKPEE